MKNGISIVNSPGTVDSGYRGELGVILINHGHEDFAVKVGDKILFGKHAGTEVTLKGETFLVMRQTDILLVL